jgi:hypothetical protein
MAIPRAVDKSLLFVGALYSENKYYQEAYPALQSAFGEIVMETPRMPWDYSGYYKDEMGAPIMRRFLFFRSAMMPDALADVKLKTIEMEKGFSIDGKRQINLDPGYLTPAKVVLASTKDYSHRIYLRDGIYAEATLIFKGKQFVPHIHTYNDYKDEKFLRFFLLGREMFFLLKMNEHDLQG